jgi:hypothetical protein
MVGLCYVSWADMFAQFPTYPPKNGEPPRSSTSTGYVPTNCRDGLYRWRRSPQGHNPLHSCMFSIPKFIDGLINCHYRFTSSIHGDRYGDPTLKTFARNAGCIFPRIIIRDIPFNRSFLDHMLVLEGQWQLW